MELVESPGSVKIHIPLTMRRRSGRKQIILPEDTPPIENTSPPAHTYQDAMVIAIARAFRWKRMLDDGKYNSIAQMADALGINRWYMSRIIRLTLIDPDIIEAIVRNTAPDGMSLEILRKPVPLLWIR